MNSEDHSKRDIFAMKLPMNITREESILTLYEPRHEKTGFLHMRKQRRRLASR